MRDKIMKCSCDWFKGGLGAEQAPSITCMVHGIDGPMPMFMSSEAAQLGRLAGVIKGKCEDSDAPMNDYSKARVEAAYGGAAGAGKPVEDYPKMKGAWSVNRGMPLSEVKSSVLVRLVQSGLKSIIDEMTELTRRGVTIESLLTDNKPRAFADGSHTAPGEERTTGIASFDQHLNDKAADDRHTFSSGASSSGKKPPYSAITQDCLERFANQRGYGDDKYGVDNWKQGARDKEFILDRINHGIEHLLTLAEQVKADNSGTWRPGLDDAAAVCCAAMFVMEWQKMRRQDMMAEAIGAAAEYRPMNECSSPSEYGISPAKEAAFEANRTTKDRRSGPKGFGRHDED